MIVFGWTLRAQDIDAKRVEAIQMAKIVPEPRFPRREQSAWPIKAEYHVEPTLRGVIIYINGPGHKTKMDVMPFLCCLTVVVCSLKSV